MGYTLVDHSDVVSLDLTPGFNGVGKDNCKTRRETFTFGDLGPRIIEIWRYYKFISSRCYHKTIFAYRAPSQGELMT